MTTQTTHQIGRGDVVKVGKGYQRWTVLARTGDQLHLESDPTWGAIAGTPARRKQTTVDRVSLLDTAWSLRVARKAHQMGIDPNHCSGCLDRVEWTLRSEDGDTDEA